jgi:hypothetical protein
MVRDARLTADVVGLKNVTVAVLALEICAWLISPPSAMLWRTKARSPTSAFAKETVVLTLAFAASEGGS